MDDAWMWFCRPWWGRGMGKRKATWGKGLRRPTVTHGTMRDGNETLPSSGIVPKSALDHSWNEVRLTSRQVRMRGFQVVCQNDRQWSSAILAGRESAEKSSQDVFHPPKTEIRIRPVRFACCELNWTSSNPIGPSIMPLTIGSRVQLVRSGRYLQSLRDQWQSAGREPEKSRAKRYYDEQSRLIGTIEEMDQEPIPGMSQNCVVRWDCGSIQFTTTSNLEKV